MRMNCTVCEGEYFDRKNTKFCSVKCKTKTQKNYKAASRKKAQERMQSGKESDKVYLVSIKYKRYLDGAKRRNYAFDLTVDQFAVFWKLNCTYCNSEISTIGLDRLDNKIGYVIGNIVPCCKTCNFMKGSMTPIDFIKKCLNIAMHS